MSHFSSELYPAARPDQKSACPRAIESHFFSELYPAARSRLGIASHFSSELYPAARSLIPLTSTPMDTSHFFSELYPAARAAKLNPSRSLIYVAPCERPHFLHVNTTNQGPLGNPETLAPIGAASASRCQFSTVRLAPQRNIHFQFGVKFSRRRSSNSLKSRPSYRSFRYCSGVSRR
jgi:hypothetical protein